MAFEAHLVTMVVLVALQTRFNTLSDQVVATLIVNS